MVTIEIDNKTVEAAEGSMIIQVADKANIYIPRFCYHQKLTIAANCRMCLVQVEKANKPLPACATPIVAGMKVFTQSKMALDAQRSVMEFLLINHPLDCPICDQGGECELQDLSLGYGNDISRYTEGKRSVVDEDLGPLIATDMTRCIQCTRCVRFGAEIAGMPELGTTQRGENLEITTHVNRTMKSELSGNIIDLCPVGALTSKPFRFRARAWELKQHHFIAPHDCVGSNLFVHTRDYVYNDYRQVMRVVPRENGSINETWISDRDRFSYEALHSPDRLLTPKIKTESGWIEVDWTAALNFIVEKWQGLLQTHGPSEFASLASPNSTVEELYLLQKLWRGLGSNNIDHRIRQLDFSQQENFPSHPQLGMDFADIENVDSIFIIGSNTRYEQPLACHRIRKAALRGATVICLNPIDYAFNFDLTAKLIVPASTLPRVLAGIARHLCWHNRTTIDPFLAEIVPSEAEIELANKLLGCKRGLLLLGNHAHHHPQASLIRALGECIAKECGMVVGALSEGANAAGAWLTGMIPHRGAGGTLVEKAGLHAQAIFAQQLKSYLIVNIEPELDCARPAQALAALLQADFVVVMSPFATPVQEQYADVILPIAPCFETSGTFINASNHWQHFTAVTRPAGNAKPLWKVLRVLGNLLKLEGFDYVNVEQVISELKGLIETVPKPSVALSLAGDIKLPNTAHLHCLFEWPMYQTDNLVRRAAALQKWAEEANRAVVRINQQVADQHAIQSGEIISVVQGESVLDFPVLIDDTIVGSYLVLLSGIPETAAFGENMGPIKLLRGYNK